MNVAITCPACDETMGGITIDPTHSGEATNVKRCSSCGKIFVVRTSYEFSHIFNQVSPKQYVVEESEPEPEPEPEPEE